MSIAFLDTIIDYHRISKHDFAKFAPGPGYLDWANQPHPFRWYEDAENVRLGRTFEDASPAYDDIFIPGAIPPAELNAQSISRLFFDSLAISAWKSMGGERWALRVNPASGNLHGEECCCITGAVPGITKTPAVMHYDPYSHEFEVRTRFSDETWNRVAGGLPEGTILLGLSMIYWRVSWKYGERAFRYCHLDAGHAIAAIAAAAAELGWKARLIDNLSTDELASLFGLGKVHAGEYEHPVCLLAVFSDSMPHESVEIDRSAVKEIAEGTWVGTPNLLSPSHVIWERLEEAVKITKKSEGCYSHNAAEFFTLPDSVRRKGISDLRTILRQRRSSREMDGTTTLSAESFLHILNRILPHSDHPVFSLLPWQPNVHAAIFVHRVDGFEPGLYFLFRTPGDKNEIQHAFQGKFAWQKPDNCPEHLELYLLQTGDFRNESRIISCNQEIASDGCFSLGMICGFRPQLEKMGAWFYPRVHWECSMIGQMLYLEAEAAGVRGTGIGCYLDDAMHGALGLSGDRYQDLYHFAVGGYIEDTNMTSLPAYPDKEE